MCVWTSCTFIFCGTTVCLYLSSFFYLRWYPYSYLDLGESSNRIALTQFLMMIKATTWRYCDVFSLDLMSINKNFVLQIKRFVSNSWECTKSRHIDLLVRNEDDSITFLSILCPRMITDFSTKSVPMCFLILVWFCCWTCDCRKRLITD